MKDVYKPLDRKEKEIMEESGRKEEKSNPDKRAEYKVKASQRISIRIENSDIEYYKKKAEETGIPYQTIITSVIHRYANGGVKIENPI